MIVAVAANWGIGWQNELLFSIPEDLRQFREKTLGKTVVMGRRTLQSLPGGRPLPKRRSIVLTENEGFAAEGAVVCHSLPQLGAALAGCADDEVFVIGGQSVYRQLAPHCSEAFVTRIDAQKPADAFFVDLDAAPGWALAERGEPREHEGIRYRYCRYVNHSAQPLPAAGAL